MIKEIWATIYFVFQKMVMAKVSILLPISGGGLGYFATKALWQEGKDCNRHQYICRAHFLNAASHSSRDRMRYTSSLSFCSRLFSNRSLFCWSLLASHQALNADSFSSLFSSSFVSWFWRYNQIGNDNMNVMLYGTFNCIVAFS